MKIPRVHDFDPNAKVPQLGSPMDHLPTIQKPKPFLAPEAKKPKATEDTPVPPVLSYGSTPVPRTVVPPRRKIKQRHPFDIYQDQLDTLRQIAAEERMKGELGSMSAMVREAIDVYLQTKKKPQK